MSTSDQNLRDCRFMLLLPERTTCVPRAHLIRIRRNGLGRGPMSAATLRPVSPRAVARSGQTASGLPGIKAISTSGIVGLIVKL